MLSNKKYYSIAIDGPAGAGKSTIAKEVARILGIEYIDTGAMYRALTLKVLDKNIHTSDINSIIDILKNTKIDFSNGSIYLDDINVDIRIRNNIISENVSYIATIEEVREKMASIQREMSKCKSIIMDGRDIGTVVLPNADYKFFIIASSYERATRRYNDLINAGESNITLEEIEASIKARDDIDSNRDIAPLMKAKDAFVIDTTNQSIKESVDNVVSIVKGR